MKKKSLMVTLFFLALASLCPLSAQNKTYRFFAKAAPVISTLAHPSTEYKSFDLEQGRNYARLKIFYYNPISDVHHTLKLHFGIGRTGPISMKVLDDTAFFPPFAATEMIKDFLLEAMKEAYDESARDEQSRLQRQFIESLSNSIQNLSGIQFSLVYLQFAWLGFD